jgi:hypothetical protein
MELGFHHHTLICQVWARGSKVVTVGTSLLYRSGSGIPDIIHWVRLIKTMKKESF